MYPKALQKLIESFRMLPGVGLKTAERYAFEILEINDDEANDFIEAIITSRTKLKKCKICANLSEDDECLICKDKERDHNIICVVQHPKDIIAMEKIQEYHGVYHVLEGVIATSKGILPADLNISSLLERINDDTKEIIVATNPTLEGETTAMYLARLLADRNVIVSRLANGLPMGGHLDYADELTLSKAMEGRQKIK